jgi:hypothetical protein
VQETDVALPGRGIPFELRRTYRSRTNNLSVLGFGWDFNYNRRIVDAGFCGNVDLLMGDGGRVRFVLENTTNPSEHRYRAPAGVPLRLRKKLVTGQPENDEWLLEDAQGIVYRFGHDVANGIRGVLKTISDRAGNTLTFSGPTLDGSGSSGTHSSMSSLSARTVAG